jgi:hypothetical protein
VPVPAARFVETTTELAEDGRLGLGPEALAAEQDPDGLAHRVDDQAGQRDERERGEGDERLVRLQDEQRAEGADDDAGGRERPTGPRAQHEPAEEHETEDDDSHCHCRSVGPGPDGPDRRYAASTADLVLTWAASASTTVGSNSVPEQGSTSATAEAPETAGAPDRPVP